jgi:hypothetical protein
MTFGVSRNDPWVAENWQQAFQSGGEFYLTTSGDAGEALSELGGSSLNALGKIFQGITGDPVPH